MSDHDDPDNEKSRGGYRPIPCALYSQYEVAIMHREQLRLHWRDAEGLDHIDRVMPRDLQTRDHCEYLIAENGEGQELQIRLDRILHQTTEPQ